MDRTRMEVSLHSQSFLVALIPYQVKERLGWPTFLIEEGIKMLAYPVDLTALISVCFGN